MLGAGGFGYFLIDARYSSTTLSAGPDTQPNNPATTRSSWGTFRCCRPSDNLPPERWLKNTRLTLLTVARRMNVGEVDAALLPTCSDQIGADKTQQALAPSICAVAEQYGGLITPSMAQSVGNLPSMTRAKVGRKSKIENIA